MPHDLFNENLPTAVCWLLAGGSALLIGLSKAGFGGGIGVIAVPMMIFAMRHEYLAIGVLLPLLMVGDFFSVGHHWKRWDARNVKLLLPGLTVGVVLGAFALLWFHEQGGGQAALDESSTYLKMAIGVICTAWVFAEILRAKLAPNWALRPTWKTGTGTGFFAGFTSTLAHTAGPIITMYLLGQKLDKRTFVGTGALYYLIGNSIKLPPYILLTVLAGMPLLDGEAIRAGLWFVLFVPIGTTLGAWMHHRINERLFRNIIMVFVLISGLELMGLGKVVRGWDWPWRSDGNETQQVEPSAAE